MSQLLPRSSLSSFRQCKACSTTSTTRKFTTSPSLQAIGPENPRFIEVPKSRQPTAHPPRDIKGTLPPPRSIFPKQGGGVKTTPEYITATVPEPQAPPKAPNAFDAWKHRLATQRRISLRDGLAELHERKQRQLGRAQARTIALREDRERRIKAPQREDERLTSTTTFAKSGLPNGHLRDPNRETRIAEKMARVKAREQAKMDERRDALHNLYMHARSFITTEEQLAAKVEEIFAPGAIGQNAVSIWEARGPPKTIQEMMTGVTGTSSRVAEHHQRPAVETGKRMHRIAEELTGGKMD